MRLKWFCGMNADTGGFFTDPSECLGEGVYDLNEHEQQDWADGITPCVICPECEQMLEDPSHYIEFDPMNPMEKPEQWEPPLPTEEFEVDDHVLYEGGVWKVVRACLDEFDDREQKLDIEWVAGARSGKMVYATGIRSSDLKKLTAMEVVAYAAQPEE